MSVSPSKPSLQGSEATEVLSEKNIKFFPKVLAQKARGAISEIASTSNGTRLAMTRIIRSQDLFQGKREIIIEHAEKHYRLLITKSGKLILNK